MTLLRLVVEQVRHRPESSESMLAPCDICRGISQTAAVTVIVRLALQCAPQTEVSLSVPVIVTSPAPTPVTTPAGLTVASDPPLLVQLNSPTFRRTDEQRVGKASGST